MSNHKNLVFFNKEGDYLNFNYSESNDRFEGDMLFHENSTDTFKTYGLYTMENIPSFEFELPGELTTKKFQLFNEYGLNLYGAKYDDQDIINIEPVNNDPSFYSKWIYGIDFESKFPTGTLIKFNSTLFEFNNINQTYAVVSSKKNAIMIIGQMDNATFESTYYSSYIDVNSYDNKTITGINAVGVYNYIDSSYDNNLSDWSEPDFYDEYYVGKKLNLVNTEFNDSVVSVENIDVTDQVHFEFSTNNSNLPDDSNFIIEVITKTDIPKVYEGGLSITTDNRIYINNVFNYPHILKSGTEFKIIGSVDNQNFLRVSNIPTFGGNTQLTYYATQSQVLFNNRIYECVKGYTQSFASQTTSFVTPLNTNYWSNPTYVKVDQSTIAESLLSAQIYLTTDRYYFYTGWTSSAAVTLASAADKYKEDLKIFNIDLFYKNNTLKSDLIYPSDYAKVNFYHSEIGATYSIGSELKTSERLVEVEEELNYELNYDISENFKYNIVFTDIDEFGILIEVNKMIYDEEVAFIYTGSIIDMERTIDRTLRSWLSRWYLRLLSLGIIAELQYVGNYTSVFYNSIVLRTEYPNVPLDINNVEVGITANYHIEHSRVLFDDMGPFLNIIINDESYSQQTIYSGLLPDIPSTLSAWMEKHSEILVSFEIFVTNINNLLKFDIKHLDRRLDYTITTGKLNIPGLQDYIITEKILGNHGMLIASNEVLLPETSLTSFEDSGFATGMVFAINNTYHPYVNQDFNIQFLDPQVMNLSYQGPFWGLTDSICNSSAFVTLAFDYGFGQTGCQPIIVPTQSEGGEFGGGDDGASPGLPMSSFDLNMFSLSYNLNEYVVNEYDLNSFSGTTGLVDIKYVQLSNSMYAYGDELVVIDAYIGQYITTVALPGNTQSIEVEFNPINNYLYCLSKNSIYVVDPLINTLINTISLSNDAFDIEMNPINGDVYVTYDNIPYIDIWEYNNLTNIPNHNLTTPSPLDTKTGKMVFNDFEGDMYITTNADLVVRIDGLTRTFQTSYGVTGLTHSIFYEPVNEGIYVYGSASLWKIDNGATQSIALPSQAFNDVIFNNITGEMNVSDSSTNFTRMNLDTDFYLQTGVSNYGYLMINQFDGDVYLSSQTYDNILVLDGVDGTVKYTAPVSAQTTKLVYNPERKSIWAIQPSINSVVEIDVELGGVINLLPPTYDTIEDNQYGTLDSDYEQRESIWLKTRDYMRRPRENFEGDVSVKYYWRWLSDNVPQFFLYDFSGIQLDRTTTGSYSYIGERPLKEVVLNKYPNSDISKVSLSQYQQTIFDKVEETLSYVDDEDDISTDVEPLQLFLGFKSENPGALRSVLQLYKKEEIYFDIISDTMNSITLETLDINNENKRGQLTILESSIETFTKKGLKPGQHIVIYLKDTMNDENQYISGNNGILLKVREVYTKTLVVDFFNLSYDFIEYENTVISDYPFVGTNTYLDLSIKVVDREIGRFTTYAETEEEDIRFKVELGNVGKLIGPNEVFIFKEYDILEGGIDWPYLNKKRKEMLMMKHLIYPYVGAYKSIINAINYFGYNDLQLNEYYKNVDPSSENFSKLFKVEIPDIFDNSVEGWEENDFIKHTMPNNKFDGTNLFNLTYFITDKEGNNVLNYSIDEIIIKLQGLKFWLKNNIIPLTHKIMDITGKSYINNGTYIVHKVHDVRIFNINQEMTPITFKLNEAYLSPVNSGSTVYDCVLDFYSIIPGVGAEITPSETLLEKPKAFNGSNLVLPDYFNIKIRTYKTYKEWVPFKTYITGDKVTYYDKLYESVIDNNRIKNPRKYENATEWNATDGYQLTNIVQYRRDFYVYSGLGNTQSSISPNLDPGNWLDVTEWRQLDYDPVQTINEFRSGDDLLPFNFIIDSNIDPFIVIEVTSDNGYGSVYSDKKNYEIRGLKDLTEPYNPIDPIGPFEPIPPVYGEQPAIPFHGGHGGGPIIGPVPPPRGREPGLFPGSP